MGCKLTQLWQTAMQSEVPLSCRPPESKSSKLLAAIPSCLSAMQSEVPKPPQEEEATFRQIQMARKYLQDQAVKQQQQRQREQQRQLVSTGLLVGGPR